MFLISFSFVDNDENIIFFFCQNVYVCIPFEEMG